ncbi:hypothetical protein F5Y13DRAFT_167548 [Hypoxylon sp. FL1857]|nr:hypothetical protein F5Y13DRAFT_167548 [Hypoxylon sp. FL1857]
MIDGSMSAAHDLGVGDAPPDVDDLAEGHSAREHIDVDIDDTETIEPLPDELFDELVNATNGPPQHKEIVPNEDASPPRDQRSPHSPPIPKPSENHSHLPTLTKELTLEQKTEDSASLPSTQRPLQPLSTHEVNSRAMNTPKEPGPDLTKPIAPTDVPTVGSPAETVSRVQQPVSATRSFRHPKTPMGPPPVPPKFKPRSHIQTKESRTPPFLLKQTHTPNPHLASKPHPNHAEGRILQQIRQECPPTSTQLFMLGHLDDFFPSPSQEVRELFGESNISIGAHDSKVNPRAANPTRAPTTRNLPAKSNSIVPDFNRPSLAVKNGTAKCDPIQASKPPVQARTSPSLFTANAQSSGNPDGFDMPFFSTQDLVFSSQDMRDLEDDTASPLGPKHRESSHQSKNMPEQQNSFSCGAARDNTSADPTTSIPLPPSKKAKYTDSSSRTESTINNGLLFHPRLLTKSREYLENSTPISKNTASLRTQVGKDGVHNPDFRNEARPLKNDEKGMPSAVERNHQINNHTLQAKKDAIAPRGSPKPFFASSGREADYKYAIERTKTTAWEGISTRQKARSELEHLQKSEDERLERLLLEGLREDGSMRAHGICASTPGSRHRDPAPRPHNQAKGLSQPRSINQLSSSAGRSTQNEKMNEPNERRPRQNQSRSSYKEMLELLKQKENQRQEQKAVPASQETDYGDAGLDDVLSEML